MGNRIAQSLLLILSLIPLLLFAYLGSHSRMVVDDYCHVRIAQEHDPLQNLAYWRDKWNGSYSDYLVHSLLAPLGMHAPAVFPTLTILVWLIALSAFVYHGAIILNLVQIPLRTAVTVASFVITIAIDRFFSPQSFYFYAAAVRHTLPIAGILAIFALMALAMQRQSRSTRGTLKFGAAAGALCFVNAGTSETFAIIQLAILSAVLLFIVKLSDRSVRSRWAVVPILGCLATLAALLVMATAPGATIRAEILLANSNALNANIATHLYNSLGRLLFYLRDSELITGFVAVLGLGLYLSLDGFETYDRKTCRPVDSGIARAPVMFALAHQLLSLPFLWAQVSDKSQLLGRFSFSYSTMLLLNLGLILGLALLLVFRSRANRILAKRNDSLLIIACVALLVAILLVAMTQLRAVDWRASTYLYVSLLTLLVTLYWQWLYSLRLPASRRFRIGVLCWYASTFAAATAVILFSNLVAAWTPRRVFSFFPFAFIFPGLIWAAHFGLAITRSAPSSSVAVAAVKSLKVVSLAVAVLIGVNVVFSQLNFLPVLQQHSEEWDARHQQIMDEIERGHRTVVVARLSFTLEGYLWLSPLDKFPCPLEYYDLDSIVVEEA